MRLIVLLLVATVPPSLAEAAKPDWSALHGDWELRIDGGGEIYFSRLRIQPNDDTTADADKEHQPALASYESNGRRGQVVSLRTEAGFHVVEVQTQRSGMPARGIFAFELVEGRIVGDVDFESGSGVRSYEFEGKRLGRSRDAKPTGAAVEGAAVTKVDAVAKADELATKTTTRVTLRQGDNGYSDAVDTEIWGIAPSKPLDRQGTMTADGNNGGGESQVLMRFGGLVGDRTGRLPASSRVVSATLRVVVFDPGSTVHLHRVLAPWDASSTWAGMAAGVSVDGVEASPVRDGFSFGEINMDRQEVLFDVTQSVQAWADGEPNHGWVFINTGGNGWDFYSSDWIEEDLRPSLEVEYTVR